MAQDENGAPKRDTNKAQRRSNAQSAAERSAAIRREQQSKERRRQSLIVGGVVLVVLLLVGGIAIAVQSSRDTTGGGSAGGVPAGTLEKYGVARGPADAPVKVTVYEDFLCPFCGQFEALSRGPLSQAAAAGKVVVDYRVLAFLGDYSKRAANAFGVVLDASGRDVAMKFHDLLYENQPQEGGTMPGDDSLVNLAVKAGAQESEVRPGIESGAFDGWVSDGTDAGSKAGVVATPTVLIDGKKVKSASIQDLVAQVEQAIG